MDERDFKFKAMYPSHLMKFPYRVSSEAFGGFFFISCGRLSFSRPESSAVHDRPHHAFTVLAISITFRLSISP